MIENELIEFFYKLQGFKYLRCLEPDLACVNKPIRAHSIQNSKVLDLLVENGHVIIPGLVQKGNAPPKLKWQKVGRHKASTFTGMCEIHDSSIFSEIDQKPFDPTNKEQLFLFAYRAACKEFHSVLEGASKIQSAYQAKVEKGLAPKDAPSESGLIATGWLVKSYETWLFRNKFFDVPLLDRNFDALDHEVFVFKNQKPVLAAAALFSLDHIAIEDDVARVSLNVIPLSKGELVTVISYPKEHSGKIYPEFDRIREGNEGFQKFEISRLLLNNSDNFVISPSHFSSWSMEKRKKLLDFYGNTIFESSKDFDEIDFFLF